MSESQLRLLRDTADAQAEVDWHAQATGVINSIGRELAKLRSLDDLTGRPAPDGHLPPSDPIRNAEAKLRDLGRIIDAEVRARMCTTGPRPGGPRDVLRSGVAHRAPGAEAPAVLAGGMVQPDDLTWRRLAQTRMAEAAHAQRYSAELREVLAELRPMGGTVAFDGDDLGDTLDAASAHFPAAWIDAANDAPAPLRVVAGTRDDRSGYNLETGEMLLAGGEFGPDHLTAQAAHELAHRVEHADPSLRVMQWAFFHRRITDPSTGLPQQPAPLVELTGAAGYDDELCCPDHFPNVYIGRVYEGAGPVSPYEVVAVGVESLRTGEHGIHDDNDWRCFVLGALAAV